MRTRLQAVRVKEVILNNETNPNRYASLGNNDAVGTILYQKLHKSAPEGGYTDALGFARPLFSSITQYPVVNEIVYLVKGPSPNYYDHDRALISYYLPPLKIQGHPLHNAFPDDLRSDKIILTNEEIEAGASNSKP